MTTSYVTALVVTFFVLVILVGFILFIRLLAEWSGLPSRFITEKRLPILRHNCNVSSGVLSVLLIFTVVALQWSGYV